MAKLAHGAVFLSQGIPFLHAGEEFLRTKHGVENSYNSPDDVNGLDWSALSRHRAVVEYPERIDGPAEGVPRAASAGLGEGFRGRCLS